MDLVSILEIIFSFSAGALVVYLTAYAKAKGNNKALKEDISKLEDEKQNIVAKYRAETEELKKQHSLDIEKRKYKYEDKRAQFTKFFLMFDQFQNKGRTIITEDFTPLLSELLSSIVTGTEENKKEAFYQFTNDIQHIINKMYEEHIKMTNETNSIRLVATPEMDILLDGFENALNNAKDNTSEMIKFMTTPEFLANQALLAPYLETNEKYGDLISEYRLKLKNKMKYELDEI
ncbi:MAG: hypothetical protein K8R39_12505 [Arcobacteraceae bacterium]|nr:hypothetical protein [Arcobacteraceae bacterium]